MSLGEVAIAQTLQHYWRLCAAILDVEDMTALACASRHLKTAVDALNARFWRICWTPIFYPQYADTFTRRKATLLSAAICCAHIIVRTNHDDDVSDVRFSSMLRDEAVWRAWHARIWRPHLHHKLPWPWVCEQPDEIFLHYVTIGKRVFGNITCVACAESRSETYFVVGVEIPLADKFCDAMIDAYTEHSNATVTRFAGEPTN